MQGEGSKLRERVLSKLADCNPSSMWKNTACKIESLSTALSKPYASSPKTSSQETIRAFPHEVHSLLPAIVCYLLPPACHYLPLARLPSLVLPTCLPRLLHLSRIADDKASGEWTRSRAAVNGGGRLAGRTSRIRA
eukprot:752609-Hanusia_phi.AAC.1